MQLASIFCSGLKHTLLMMS